MSVENYLPWAFRLVVLGLVAWTVFCILRKVLRRAGIVAYPPFTSRKDYLEAAREMNLEDFIGRAKATPRSLIQKPTVPDLKIKMASQESIFETINSMVNNFSRGLEETVSLKKVEAAPPSNLVDGPAGTVGISGQDRLAGSQWFRLKETGELGHTCGIQHPDGRFCFRGPEKLKPFVYPSDLEPAYPRKGEWWRWTRHERAANECPPYNLLPFLWNADGKKHLSDVVKGLLEPVNFGFGKGEDGSVGIVAQAIGGAAGVSGIALPQPHKWLRLKESGSLVRFSGRVLPVEFGTYELSEGKNRLVTCHRVDLEPAYPKRGEWWQKHVCHVPHNLPNMETSWISGVVQWHYSTNAACESHGPEIMAAQCGCLTPVNFGKGNVNQA